MKRGQGTFEYVLLLGGVLLIVVLAIVVLQNTAQQSFQGAGKNQCTARLLTDFTCQTGSGWNACGQVSGTSYKDCGTISPTGLTDKNGAACAALAAGQKYCGLQPAQ